MKKILVIGEVLVEIMADTQGNGFLEAIPLTGPFPSGAPAIFADQAARIGQPVALISAVGDDDFGRINLERLKRDHVDISGIYIDPDRPTGSAFVRYRTDGSRDFVFNIRHSASGTLHKTDIVKNLIETADHIHVMGTSLSSQEFVEFNIEAAKAIRARGGTVSFDPNLRKEMLEAPGVADAMSTIIALTDLYLPSDAELTLLTRAKDKGDAIAELLHSGIKAIVHKQGAQGASYHTAKENLTVKVFPVDEIDPTGAGDCFGATFTSLWLRDLPPADCLKFAAAAGAFAVTKRGPMEGTSDFATLEKFVRV